MSKTGCCHATIAPGTALHTLPDTLQNEQRCWRASQQAPRASTAPERQPMPWTSSSRAPPPQVPAASNRRPGVQHAPRASRVEPGVQHAPALSASPDAQQRFWESVTLLAQPEIAFTYPASCYYEACKPLHDHLSQFYVSALDCKACSFKTERLKEAIHPKLQCFLSIVILHSSVHEMVAGIYGTRCWLGLATTGAAESRWGGGSTWQDAPKKPELQVQVPSSAQLPRPRQVMAGSQPPGQGCRLQRCAVDGLIPGHKAGSTRDPPWSAHVMVRVVTPPACRHSSVPPLYGHGNIGSPPRMLHDAMEEQPPSRKVLLASLLSKMSRQH